jgi:CdiI N-terminal domain
MTGFSITFTDATAKDGPAVAVGEIRLGEYRESFHTVTGYWSIHDYEASWTAALRRLLAGGTLSCLVTSLTDPQEASFVTTWPLYRNEEEVFVQNQILFLDELPAPFAPHAPWESADPRTTADEEGRPISE